VGRVAAHRGGAADLGVLRPRGRRGERRLPLCTTNRAQVRPRSQGAFSTWIAPATTMTSAAGHATPGLVPRQLLHQLALGPIFGPLSRTRTLDKNRP